MRFLQYNSVGQLSLTKDLVGDDIPEYAILSHTWGADTDEVTFRDLMEENGKSKAGYKKIRFCKEQARRDKIQYFWVDTCCIDKTNSVELQEAINSMFRWYRNSAKCYVYLSDVSTRKRKASDRLSEYTWESAFRSSRWFTRGWTLQELLAPGPDLVEFFSQEGDRLGNKRTLGRQIYEITGIPISALRGTSLSQFDIDDRLLWAENRQTTRKEDKAYSLFGIFDIQLPLLYGEGENKAFQRLREEINKPLKGLDCLPFATDALFNSFDRQDEFTCLPNTRVDLLQEIYDWADGQDERCTFWLNGLAGTGKSTIARTVARRYFEEERLGASFFFSRGGGDVSHAGKFFTSIAVQLANNVPSLRQHIYDAITKRKDIASQSLRDQWCQLILRPLSRLGSGSCPSSYVLIIDALDECDKEEHIRTILQLLAEARILKTVRLRVFLTSRSEIPIRHSFYQIPDTDHQEFILHNISRSIVNRDISIFLQYNLNFIAIERSLGAGWPGEQIVKRLVCSAGGLFIWAATACRFIREGKRFATKRLNMILESSTTINAPEKHLNEIYLTVLRHSISPEYTPEEAEGLYYMLKSLLGSIVTLLSPLSTQSLGKLVNASQQEVDQTLDDLHAILDIPKDQTCLLRLHHPSFRDFLLNKYRCNDSNFWVDQRQAHRTLVDSCMRLMSTSLKQDICGLGAPGVLLADVESGRVEECLPLEVKYACLHWVQHLQKSGPQLQDNDQVHQFLQVHLLHWLEALSLIRRLSESIRMINILLAIVDPITSTTLSRFLYDAKRFVLSYCSIADSSPLQLYSSALIFAPEASIIRNTFQKCIPSWISQQPKVESGWNAVLQTLEGHSNKVNSVAFSHDSRMLASASSDKTVKIWNASTGSLQQTLEGHSSWVWSVAFSHDSKLLASASEDETVKIWDVSTGSLNQTLKGHSDWVWSVAFSHDSRLLASASCDKTVKIWDASTSSLQQTLEGHSGWVRSVAFSHNSRLLASASDDKTVKIWDTSTGSLQQTLKDYSDSVRSVVFSHDSKLLASASDKIVKIWDISTSSLQQTLEGHSGLVRSVAFSNDSRLLASASDDETVKIWDTSTGSLQQTLEGHSGWVRSVAFSHDSKLLASASDDETVKTWDASTSSLQQTLEGHSGLVWSVAFSHDSRMLASASEDEIVKIWDVSTGSLQQTLEGHSDWVWSVAFSHDSRLLASASEDKTVKIWNTSTGSLQQTLKGHSNSVKSVAFSHDSKLLVSASDDKTVKIWDVSTSTLQQTLEGHSDWVRSVAFSHDSKLLASASEDKTVKIWDTSTSSLQQTLKGHSDLVWSVAFSHDSRLLASASGDKIVKIWDAITGSCYQTVAVNTYVTSLSFDSADLNLLTNGSSIKVDRTGLLTTSGHPQEGRDEGGRHGLGISESWVTWNTRNLLWLPPDYRPVSYNISPSRSVVVGGCSSGKVFIIEFSLANVHNFLDNYNSE